MVFSRARLLLPRLRPVVGGLAGGLAWSAAEERFDGEVDYIVVGAGSAGCAVAARLALGAPDAKTLLLEAGFDDDVPEIQTAVDYFGKVERIFGSDRDWIYGSEAQAEIGGRGLYWPRGKVVGGCSSFNTMVWLRGDPTDFDDWARILGDDGWGFEGVLPYFRAAEDHPSGPSRLHGAGGPISVAPLNHARHHADDASSEVTRSFVKCAGAMGVRANDDFAEGLAGAGCNDVNARDGRRCSTSAYLKRVGAYPSAGVREAVSPDGALTVRLERETRRVLFEGGRAIGVEVMDGSGRRTCVRARREVVLCAGAVNTPLLLIRSGVGPAAQLERLGIAPAAILPGVGQNLIDHLHVPLSYRVDGGLKPHSHSNICEGSLFARVRPPYDQVAGTYDPRADAPDLQIHCGAVFFHPDGFNPIGEGFTLTPSLIRPKSRGSIELAGSATDDGVACDVGDGPVIRPGYLTHSDDLDLLVRGVKFARELGARVCADVGAAEIFPGPSVTTDAEIEAYVRSYVSTMYHPTSTCRMGPDGDAGACLDSSLRVRGVAGLRVADASAMPDIVTSNTNATCVMIGEKCADLVLRDRAM